MLKLWLNHKYLSINKVNEIKKKFANAKPFPHLVLKDFFLKDKLKKVLEEIHKEDYVERNSDLFQFRQSSDLLEINNQILKEFYLFFSSKEFRDYISNITNINLNAIDMSAFIYSQTDYLLPHDDQLEGRKIAYVVNLSDFKRKDGGRLQLFSSKDTKPGKIIKSYSPEFNNFVLFQVSKISFHQVEEILGRKERISLAGWFHG